MALLSPLAKLVRAPLRQPAISDGAARMLESAGAHTLVDRLNRLRFDDELRAVTVPPGPDALRSRRFQMFTLDGRDQVIRAMRDGGWNGFEHPLPTLVTALVRAWPDTVFDVGANTGLYSLIAVTAHRQVRVHAGEAVPEIATLLRANLAVNPAGRRVTVHEVAAGDSTGSAVMHLPPAQADGTIETSASLQGSFKPEIDRRVEVPLRRLDEIWADAGRPAVSLLKLDVEGAEAQALAGAGELLDACRPVLAVEILTDGSAAAAEALRADHRYVDATLSPVEMVVNRVPAPDRLAPNHLLIPWERLGRVVEVVRSLRQLKVTLLP